MDGTRRPYNLRGIHVLIVDDNPDAREIIAWTLSYCGAVVTRASSPRAAFALLERFGPDVVVCDFSMPGEDGFSFIRRVRALPSAGRNVPAVALTGFDGIANAAAAKTAGFQEYLVKPFDLASFCAALRRIGFAVDELSISREQRRSA